MTEIKRTDFEKICRTCLLEKEDMESIFNSDTLQMLMSFTNIKITEDEQLPKLVCKECLQLITDCYKTKKRFETNQHILATANEVKSDSEDDYFSGDETPIQQIKDEKENQNSDNEVHGTYKCPTCPKNFSFSSHLAKHILTHKITKEFTCDLCESSFKYSWNLNRHKKLFHSDKQQELLKCHVCNSTVKHLQTHLLNVHTTESPHECSQCGRFFKSKYILKQHVRLKHLGKRVFRLCSICGQKCESMKSLEIHIRTHTGEKPFQCVSCEKNFKTISALNRHKKQHTGERPYKCDHCDKTFGVRQTLKTHILTHTGERPHVCHICQKSFTQTGSLKTHMKVHV